METLTLTQEAREFVSGLLTHYFSQSGIDALTPVMEHDASWIGCNALFWNWEEAAHASVSESPEDKNRFHITASRYQVTCLSETACVVTGEITAAPDDPACPDWHGRVTAVCQRNPAGMRLVHLHLSSPDNSFPEGRLYEMQSREASQRSMASIEELRAHNRYLEAFTENIPGGVHQCACDESLTLRGMSRSFLTLTGYSREEIRERFHNSYAEMIYPADLERVRATIKEHLTHGDAMELEYRLLRGDGELLWILDQARQVTMPDGTQAFYCVLLDITRQKCAREDLRLSLERHRIIMDQTTDIIFEWDILQDTLIFSQNWRKKFGYEPIHEDISRRIPTSRNVHPDDMPTALKIMTEIGQGVPYSESEFRIRDILGNYTWSHVRATVQYDLRRQPIKAVGVILDVDADKKQKLRLIDMAQRDALTKLYNRVAVKELATQKMRDCCGGKSQALLIVDVDNFKQVNDTYGHLCGDSLLTDVAQVLKSQFRSTDLVGRIGGDEFVVYMPEITGEKATAAKVRSVLQALHKIRPAEDAPPISCSIGVALFPQKGADYYALYKCADMALYYVKARGRNNFAFYNPSDCEGNIPCGLAKSAISAIDSELGEADSVGEKLAQYTFRMLYDSIDLNTAVQQLLELVGKAYDVSRVYIFESSRDGLQCSNTFEWCNEGVSSEMDRLQNLSYAEDLGNYLQNFDENGVFYCLDIQELHENLYGLLASQRIQSLLQCAILDEGCFQGFVGFDECRENRRWTKEQVNSLTLIANVLSTFLIKYRLKEQLAHEDGAPPASVSQEN